MKKRVKRRVKYDIIMIISFIIFFTHLGVRVNAMEDVHQIYQTTLPEWDEISTTGAHTKTATESSIVTENIKTTTSLKEKDVIETTTEPTLITPDELLEIDITVQRMAVSNSAIVTAEPVETTSASSILLAENYDSEEDMPKVTVSTPTPPPTPEPPSKTYKAPKHSGFKSWLPHKKENGSNMFASWSAQYRLQEKSVNSPNGLRKYKGRYLIALGSYYTKTIGTYVDLIMEDGTVIKCILGDQKANKDTDSKNQIHNDGSLVEFLVDRSAIPYKVKYHGDTSYVDKSFNQKVTYIKVYKKIAKF